MFNKIFLSLLLAFSPVVHAQTTGVQGKFNSAPGVDYYSNLIINPSAFKNVNNVTSSSLTVTRDTDSADQIAGVASFNLDGSNVLAYADFALNTPSSEQTVGNCEFKGLYKGDGSLYRAQITDGSSTELIGLNLQSVTNWTEFSVNYPCGASGARKVRIYSAIGIAPAINVGKLYYGIATNIGKGIPNNTFVAFMDSSGNISGENEDFISGNCGVSDTSYYSCTLVSGKFLNKPVCNVTVKVATDSSTTSYTAVIADDNSTTTSLQFRTAGGGSKVNLRANITCIRSSSDFIQPAITSINYDYPDTAYTPTIGNSPTFTSSAFTHARKGGKIILKGYMLVSASGAASTMTVSAPSGITFSLTNPEAIGFGAFNDSGVSIKGISVLLQNSTNIVFIVENTGSSITGSGLTSGDWLRYEIAVPVVGWTETANAPQLLGSVTSNAADALRIEYATVSSAGVVSLESSDWINGNAVVSDTSSFALTKTNASGLTNCWATIIGTPSSTASSATTSADSTTVSVRTYTNNAYAAQQFKIYCMGTR